MLRDLLSQFETFLFVFIRVISILMTVPFFGSNSFPIKLRVGLSLLMGFMLTPTLGFKTPIPPTLVELTISVLKEVLIGIAIGLTVKFVFTSLEIAGQLAGIQMGYAVATVFDPQTSSQLSVLAQFYNLLGILLFFSLNLHIIFIGAIRESFETIPPYSFTVTEGFIDGLLLMTGRMFVIAIKLAAPVMVALLLTNIAIGVIARVAPQLNVFIIGFPITIAVGLLVLLFSMPFIISVLNGVYIDLSHNIIGLLKVVR